MIIIENKNSISENTQTLGKLIDLHLEPFLGNRRKNQQKILEICHVGKFLMFYENRLTISKVTEKPDFILTNGTKLIGLEHQIVVDNKSKEREGFFRFNSQKWLVKTLQSVVIYDVSESLLKLVSINFFYL